MLKLQIKTYVLVESYIMALLTNRWTGTVALLIILSIQANAQAPSGFGAVGGNLWGQVNGLYQFLSIIVALGSLFYGGKQAMAGLKGEQGAWEKFGAVLAICAIWFFAIPPFIDFLASQGKTNKIQTTTWQ